MEMYTVPMEVLSLFKQDRKTLENIITILIPYADEIPVQETIEETVKRLLEELHTLREVN